MPVYTVFGETECWKVFPVFIVKLCFESCSGQLFCGRHAGIPEKFLVTSKVVNMAPCSNKKEGKKRGNWKEKTEIVGLISLQQERGAR